MKWYEMGDRVEEIIVPKIVRCKNCSHYNAETKGCNRNPSVEAWEENDFCSYGKSEVKDE